MTYNPPQMPLVAPWCIFSESAQGVTQGYWTEHMFLIEIRYAVSMIHYQSLIICHFV
jgi:hypothetical protein